MVNAWIQILLYGLVAGLSPVAFAATLAVMPGGRVKAVSFAVGFVGAQALACSLLVALGVALGGSSGRGHASLRGGLALALAAVLVVVASRLRRRSRKAVRPSASERMGGRTQALLERLGRLHVATTFVAGLLLGIGGPKRLVVTSLAATTIAAADAHLGDEAALTVAYVVVATALVWAPVLALLVAGKRVIAFMETASVKLERRQPQITVYVLLGIGAVLGVAGLSALLI